MYLRLLTGTLKKKKAQSLILIILLCLSSVLFLTSIEIYYISTVCVKRFVEKSNIASVVMWKTYKTDDTVKLRRLGAEYDYIKDVTVQDVCFFDPTSIRFGAQGKKLSESLSVFFSEYNASYNLVCPITGNAAAEPERGKIAIPFYIAELTGTKAGDFVTISAGGTEHRFFIQYVFKDALFGSEYISTKRILVHTADLDILLKNPRAKHNSIVNFFLENDSCLTKLLSDYSAAGFSHLFYIDKILLYQIYRSSNGIIAVVFLCASLFVGLMCFFIQKYSVITTLHDEYEQIALMRATGFTAYAVKKLYAVKYAFIGFIGCVLGYAGNRLLAALAVRHLGKSIIIYNFLDIIVLSFILSAIIWLMFMCLTYMQMKGIKRMTPIEMKQPNKGKKTRAFAYVRLHTQNIHPSVVLAVNTFIAKLKSRGKYIITLTPVFSFMLIAVNLKNTLTSDGFISYSGLTVADIYTDTSVKDHVRDDLIKKVNSYNEILAENKEQVVLGIDFYKEVNIADAAGRSAGITALKSAASTSTFRFINGQPPREPNEIALTSVLLQRYDKKIGDTVLLEIDGVSEKYLITAVNQALYNMGELILLPDNFEVKDERIGYEVIAFVSDKNLDKTSYITFLQNRYPFLSGVTAQERIYRMTGGMTAQIAAALDVLIITMFVLVCVLTILFTELMCNGESFSFSLLRIIGFDCKRLFAYQSVCTALIMLPAAAASCCICAGAGSALTASLFTFTGLARFELTISGLHTFVYFPFLFTLTVFAVSGAVYGLHNKINLKGQGWL